MGSRYLHSRPADRVRALNPSKRSPAARAMLRQGVKELEDVHSRMTGVTPVERKTSKMRVRSCSSWLPRRASSMVGRTGSRKASRVAKAGATQPAGEAVV